MKKIILSSIVAIFLMSAGVVWAQAGGSPSGSGASGDPNPKPAESGQKFVQLQNPLKVNNVREVIFFIVDMAVYVGVSFSILAIIWTGFKMVMAQGNSKEIEDARSRLLWILIGLAVLLSSKVIVDIVQNTLVKSGVVNEKVINF